MNAFPVEEASVDIFGQKQDVNVTVSSKIRLLSLSDKRMTPHGPYRALLYLRRFLMFEYLAVH